MLRVESEPGFILHSMPYRETSLLVDLFTREHGRVRCIAKGYRKPNKKGMNRSIFPFTEHQFSWKGQGDLKNLTAADPIDRPLLLGGELLFSGLYVNELLYRLLHQQDPHQDFYSYYRQFVNILAEGNLHESHLRQFEMLLMEELGYGLVLDFDSESGEPISKEGDYVYHPEQGLVSVQQSQNRMAYKGEDLLAIVRGNFSEKRVLRTAKHLMRGVIDFYLNGKPLNSRELYRRHLESSN